MDTIFAIASGAPPAAIAIIRVSGPAAFEAAKALSGELPPVRQAALRSLRDPATGDLLDRAVMLCFAGPNSATGQDCAEFHVHGGRAVVAAILGALSNLPGLRGAEPGEFTRRALMMGRIDLAQAEGLGDLLAAQTESQRRAAMASVEGAVGKAVSGWSAKLLAVSAIVEAALDFSDEDDVGDGLGAGAMAALRAFYEELTAVLATPAVERLRDGVRVVLAGPPNSGKSTLLNCLAERDVAIVSAVAGTTRDRIEAPIVRAGIAYVIIDTAGLAEETDDEVEAIGIARAGQAMAQADIILWMGDEAVPSGNVISLFSRADARVEKPFAGQLSVSAHSGAGISALWEAIDERARALIPREDQLMLNRRQRALCVDCARHVEVALGEDDLLLVAENLRLARAALDGITGTTGTEAMLDALFSRFCVGK
ncbi:MAG: tRNA uridine-5-carboxymethylaminomethyl(34) synthesis GTPase MnmE [Sphingomonas sp.]|jgi:tRNA modification GTPase